MKVIYAKKRKTSPKVAAAVGIALLCAFAFMMYWGNKKTMIDATDRPVMKMAERAEK